MEMTKLKKLFNTQIKTITKKDCKRLLEDIKREKQHEKIYCRKYVY